MLKYLSSDYIKFPKPPEEGQHSTSLFLETHSFPQCLGSIDGTHIAVIEPQHHYTNSLSRKGCNSINVPAACDYGRCCW